MREVHLTMTDLQTKTAVYRSIDITCAMHPGSDGWELRGIEDQRARLEDWITERGNEQHATTLRLDHWVIG